MIFYCGIDIAKCNHEALVIDAEGKPLLDSITITNTQEGCEKVFSLFERIWLTAQRAAFCDPILSEYYQSLKTRGKHHLTAVSAVSRKMYNIIFTILKENRPYEVTPPKNNMKRRQHVNEYRKNMG